jgi:phosphoribosyl 1,2-cyclic phosphate phosphodiesterase
MSKITLLGTGACEGIPAPFCGCDLCRHARQHGGRDVRRRFGVLIDDETMIDFGPDAVDALRHAGADDTKIRRILVTHSHVDHFEPLDLIWRTAYEECPEISLYSGEEVRRRLQTCINDVAAGKFPRIKLVNNVPGVPVQDDRWRILPVQAAHCLPDECAFLYLVETPEKKRVLIFSDTGNPPEATWEQLKDGMADAIVIEMSFGIHEPWCDEEEYHLGARAALKMIDRLKSINALKPDALCVTAHISHCSDTRHSTLEEYFKDKGIQAGYDGFSAEI